MMGRHSSCAQRAITGTAGVAGQRRRFQIEGFGEARPAEIALESIECIREGLRICEEEIRLIDEAIACEKIPYPTRIPSKRPQFPIRSTEISTDVARRCSQPKLASPDAPSDAGFDWFTFPGISWLISYRAAKPLRQTAATIGDLAKAGRIFIVGKSGEAVILKSLLRKRRKQTILVAPGYGRTSGSNLVPPCIRRPARGSFVARLLAGDLASSGVGAVVFVDSDGVTDDLSLLATAEVGIPAVVCGRSPNGALHVAEVHAKGIPAPASSQAKRPKISIVTVSFNQAAYLEASLKSVLDQGYPNLEYVVVDGGSSDGSVDIINRYRDRLSAVVIEPDQGQSDALNKGFALATGDLMTWLCSDDMLEPRSLDRVADAYIRHRADVVVGGCVRIGETRDDELLRHHTSLLVGATAVLEPFDILRFMRSWERGNYFFQPEVFFSRRIWEASGGYIKRHLFYMMDYDLWLRMALAGALVHHFPFTIACSRVHGGQKTRPDRRWYHQARQIMEEYRDVFLHLKKAIDRGWASDSISSNSRGAQGERQSREAVADTCPGLSRGEPARSNAVWHEAPQTPKRIRGPQAYELFHQKLRRRTTVMLRAIGFDPGQSRLFRRLRALHRGPERPTTIAGALLRKSLCLFARGR